VPALIAALSIAACGSSSVLRTTVTHAVRTRPATTPRSPSPGTLRVGQTYEVTGGGAFLAVTVTKVIDPLNGSGAALLPDTRAVGVKLKVLNHGPGTYDSSATGDVSLVVSSGSAVPTFSPSGACQTPLRDFDNNISPGESREGCVTFSAPSRAKVLEVRFAPHANKAAAARYSWTVG
jgi:hypothetical protein